MSDLANDERAINAIASKVQDKITQAIIDKFQENLFTNLSNIFDEKFSKWNAQNYTKLDNLKSQICESLNDSIDNMVEAKFKTISSSIQSNLES